MDDAALGAHHGQQGGGDVLRAVGGRAARDDGPQRRHVRGQLGADRLGERRLKELVAKSGKDKVLASYARLFEIGEARVRAAIDALPAGLRAAVLLRIYEELSFEEIGRILERNEVAARKRYSRALAALRESLGELWKLSEGAR